MIRMVARLGELALSLLAWIGSTSMMFWQAMVAGARPPFGGNDLVREMARTGIRSLPMATFMAAFIGGIFALQFGSALAGFGATMAVGKVASLGLVQELVPSVLAVTVGARIAAGMTSELGSMKVTEQIDALAALGADPIKKLVWPRIASGTAALVLLVVWGNIVALCGATLVAYWAFAVPIGYFYQTYVEQLALLDYFMSLTKGLAFGMIVTTIGCANGFSTKSGAAAVGNATRESVVAAALTVIVADFLITMVFLRPA